MDTENEKGIIVYFSANHVNDGSQMFARHCPVGTGALHLKIRPLTGKNFQSQLFGNCQDFGVEFAVQQFGNQRRTFNDFCHQAFNVVLEKGRHDNRNLVGRRSRPHHFGNYLVVFNFNIFHMSASRIRSPARQAIVIIHIFKRFEPVLAPPRFSELFCHRFENIYINTLFLL